ncbi:AAA family ATPase [Streptomyces ossamyceticus]|uniref:ATP-binding protein n=1 Tax=Streptomyces ossamyceticus TaxID=249581 RepID=A0ABV2UVA5_9ACTN
MPGETGGTSNEVGGPVEGGTVFQAGYIGSINTGAAASVPVRLTDALPPRPTGLVGRARELSVLERFLDPSVRPETPALALAGPGGVGKTSLALEAAYRARDKGWLRGRILHLDVRAHGADTIQSVPPLLQALLRQFGLPGPELPSLRASLEQEWRAALRREKEGLLILVEDVMDPEQLRSLIPGDDHHRLLVTSRTRPEVPGVGVFTVDKLSPEASLTLLRDGLPDEEFDENTLLEVAELCSHLPHSLRFAATRLREPATVVEEFIGALRTPDDRLTELGLTPLYDASYALLDEQDGRLLRLLSVHPGADFDADAAAALGGTTVSEARRALHRLCDKYFLEWTRTEGRFRFHDLMWQYTRSKWAAQGSREESRAAQERLLLSHAARAADASEGWLDQERHAAVALAAFGVEIGRYAAVDGLAAPFIARLTRQAQLVDALHLLRYAVIAAHESRGHAREAELLVTMSRTYRAAGLHEDARACAEAAHLVRIRIGVFSPEFDDELAEHSAARGDNGAAAHHYARAARTWERRGRRDKAAVSLSGLGRSWGALGRPDRAAWALERAAAAAEETGDLAVAARARLDLAQVMPSGSRDLATEHLRRGLHLARHSGDVAVTIELLIRLSEVYADEDVIEKADELIASALDLVESHRLYRTEVELQIARVRRAKPSGRPREPVARQHENGSADSSPTEAPSPPVFRPNPHERVVLARLYALPALSTLWALGWLGHGMLTEGPAEIWVLYVGWTVAGFEYARHVWRRSRGNRLEDVMARYGLWGHAVCCGGLLAVAAASGLWVGAAGAALLLGAQLVWGTQPLLRRTTRFTQR